jgi:hypothetical protein
MGQRPRHAGERESLARGLVRSAREIVWNGDTALLLVVALGVLLWPWLGWIAAAVYFALAGLVAVTLWLVLRRRHKCR